MLEDTKLGTAIRYRMHLAAGPAKYATLFQTGAINHTPTQPERSWGKYLIPTPVPPLPNILVSAGGQQYFTDSLGRFELIGLPEGTQNLVAYSLDGMYQTFEQGATIGGGNTTSVDVRVKPAQIVSVTFTVTVPEVTVPGVPVRIAGNILQLGNTFADLQGGVSTNTDRMPILSLQPDGTYSVTIGLPIGRNTSNTNILWVMACGTLNTPSTVNGICVNSLCPRRIWSFRMAFSTWAASDSSSDPVRSDRSICHIARRHRLYAIQYLRLDGADPHVAAWQQPLGI